MQARDAHIQDMVTAPVEGSTESRLMDERFTEKAIQEHVERQDQVIALQQDIAGVGHDLPTLMRIVAERCQSLTSADGAVVELAEEGAMVYAAVSGIASPHLGLRLEQSSSLSGKCVRENRLFSCEDTETDSHVDREACRKIGIRSMVLVPLQQGGRTMGVLKVMSRESSAFDGNDITALQLISGFLSVAMLTAITARDLRQNEARLREAQHVARIGSWERDLVTNRILWSEEMFRLFRFDPAEGTLTFERMMTRIHPEDRDTYRRVLATAIENRQRCEIYPRLLFDDGTLLWGHTIGNIECDENGKAVRWFGTFMDVTEQKQSELALRRSQESLNRAQAMAHVGSWERDYRTGTMLWSDELYRLCGLEPGSITPSIEALFAFTHPLDRKRAQERMQQSIQNGQGAEIEHRLIGADRVERHVMIRTEILEDENGKLAGSRGTVADITERVNALQEQTKFGSLIENSSDFIAMASLDGVLLTMNPAGRKLVGIQRSEDVETTLLSDIVPGRIWDQIRRSVLPTVMQEDRWEGELQLVHSTTGKVHDMQTSFFLIRNPLSGEVMCLATVQRDITEEKWLFKQLQENVAIVQEQNMALELHRQELALANAHLEVANQDLETLAMTDGPTGAKNHRAFQKIMTEEFVRSQRTCQPFSVILLDVDRFKQYNDTYGHQEGDQVLKEVVRILQETARETDHVARYGGEEFVVLLPGTGTEGAMEAAERFRAAIEKHDWPMCPVTASFGVATVNALIETGAQLVAFADQALYGSKAAGRNRVTQAETIPQKIEPSSLTNACVYQAQ